MLKQADKTGLSDTASRLSALRASLKSQGLAGFIVPKTDAFQNESVPAHEDRLEWLTGFTGSAGVAVVLQDKAALIVDSRYTLQAKAQADLSLFSVELAPPMTSASYLSQHAPKNSAIGYDPRLHTLSGFKTLRAEVEKSGLKLTALRRNPIDALWTGRPRAFHAPIFLHDENLVGESAASKLQRLQNELQKNKADGLLVSAPDSVAWLFNIRGRDVAHTPMALVRAFLPAEGKPLLFVSKGHITEENKTALAQLAIIHDAKHLDAALKETIGKDAKILADPSRTTVELAKALKRSGAKIKEGADPCILSKARKNAAELEGARNAHKRDGVALARFLIWLDGQDPGTVDEIGAAERLEGFRRESNLFEDSSFDTISGAGPNGAIVHYRVTPSTNRPLAANSLYLVDSGAQYRDGTTDVTRTVAIGEPTAEMRRHFTLVLKGNIAIATARFPAGTRGVDLDAFARRALWNAGLDYGHGTGHGVGSFLSVHEGPQNISRNGMAALEPGMIVSNEPGYYREGQYGIRIENLLIVAPAEALEGGELPMMSFETLTLAPMDRRLVDTALLSKEEIDWLDSYHARVYREIAPSLNSEEKKWLKAATAPLGK